MKIKWRAAMIYKGKAREIARRMKNPTDEEALETAARVMAEKISDLRDPILIPAPSSTGLNRATEILADFIRGLLGGGAQVVVAVRRTQSLPSSHLMRRAGKTPPTLEDHIASMEMSKQVLSAEGYPIVIVDNVRVTGHTVMAMVHHLEDAVWVGKRPREVIALVYADASRVKASPRKNPAGGPPRVCVSGSRGYQHLERVERVIESLPDASVIVHGGAIGVDHMADQAARRCGMTVETWPAQWSEQGRAAGPIRNREMVRTCDMLYAFWDGASRGTASAIKAAEDEGVPYEIILDEEDEP